VQGKKKIRVRNGFVELIQQHAAEEAVMMLSAITPAGYMVYLQSLRHSWTQDRLSKSCYGNKQSDLFNLFRIHMAQASQLILSRNLATFCMVFIALLQ
jgi:hypothetical protein